jgi:N-acetyl-D-muramate 6-phosphate phosphatase
VSFIPQAIFFDLDGTLIDSAPDLGAAADQLRTDRGLPAIDLAEYRSLAGAGARGMLKIAFGMTPEHADYEALREEFYLNYEQRLTKLTYAFDGVRELLDGLDAQRILWGIVTNKSRRFTDPLVAQMPLLTPARAVVSGDTTPHAKPHPAPLIEAARIAGVDAKRCWYVGDDRRDIEAARAAGMFSIAATWGYLGEHAVETWGADRISHTPTQLLQLLRGLDTVAALPMA